MSDSKIASTDLAIIGPGPVGLITALACAQETNFSISLFGPCPSNEQLENDTRTTAFMVPSLTMLDHLNLWPAIKKNAAPLEHLRMIDDCASLLRAPDCSFSAQELGLEAFAQNIPNKDLNQQLITMVTEHPNITWVETKAVTSICPEHDHVMIQTQEGASYRSSVLIGADGRNSPARRASGIKEKVWSYEQTAISCNFTHEYPHNATSVEFHRPSGPLTLIPLKENHASLVWSLRPKQADEMIQLSTDQFSQQLEQTMHSIWGPITSVGKRVAFPIKGMKLDHFAAKRIFLVGEAAHVVPPIGAQGLNLGVRDVAYLVESLKSKTDLSADIHSLEAAYNKARQHDVWSRTTTIDWLNKSLLLSYLPLKILRSAGLNAMNASQTLRKLLMNEGLGTSLDLPPLMRQKQKVAS